MAASTGTCKSRRNVDPLDDLLELCDVLREIELLTDGAFKTLTGLHCRLEIRKLLFVLLLPAPRRDTVTTNDHLKEARDH